MRNRKIFGRYSFLSLLLVILFIALHLSSASANMAAPFSFGSATGNFITNPKNILRIEEEDLRFELPGKYVSNWETYIDPGKIFIHISYKIVNSYNDATFTFIFPALGVSKNEFNVEVSQKKIPFESKNLYEVEALFKNNDEKEKLENVVSLKDRVYLDPLTNKEYMPSHIYGISEMQFFVFNLFLKKDVATTVNVDFESIAGSDTRRYQKNIYHYYYVLNVGDFYSSFKNLKISISYPKGYPLTSNLEGTISEAGDKKILTIVPDRNSKNLSFSYMEGRISKFGIFLYKVFPFLYGEALGFFLIFIVLPFILIAGLGVIIHFLIIRKNRRNK